MQLVDSKLYIGNAPSHDIPALGVPTFGIARQTVGGRRAVRAHGNLISMLQSASASARLLALMVAALVVVASPVLVATVRSTVSLSLQILSQAGHFGFIALEIFGR
jgi:hypothetical protein